MLSQKILLIAFLFLFLPLNFGYELTYYHSDHLGSTALTTDSISRVSQINYGLFGEPLSNINKGYNQKEHDATSFTYFEARYQDPETGRFLTSDSVEKFPNSYTYVANNPLKYIDPTGNKFTIRAGILDSSYKDEVMNMLNDFVGQEAFGTAKEWDFSLKPEHGQIGRVNFRIHTKGQLDHWKTSKLQDKIYDTIVNIINDPDKEVIIEGPRFGNEFDFQPSSDGKTLTLTLGSNIDGKNYLGPQGKKVDVTSESLLGIQLGYAKEFIEADRTITQNNQFSRSSATHFGNIVRKQLGMTPLIYYQNKNTKDGVYVLSPLQIDYQLREGRSPQDLQFERGLFIPNSQLKYK